ncbi:MAG: sigma-54-dependent Fis family transcriptional regulator [Deltaproteobacteria bacterium]|nr:sigma-54-dependent Fis family transcriptional regulator [Deltaproteobacteria bacterium]
MKVTEAELADCSRITFGKTEGFFRLSRAGRGRVKIAVFEGMVGNSAPMLDVYAAIRKYAEKSSPVLITGETGTGKEIVARAMHKLSGRPDKTYVTLNCATLPRDLAESELFGHEKGAFTGAHEARAGAFEAADGGTLFLDEIGEMPLEMQAKLLRAVQYGEVKRVGGNKTTVVKTRVVAATNRDLAAEVKAGKFREDLFYRLNVIPIALPPLRDRLEDVPVIADYLLDEMSEGSVALTDKAKAKLKTHDWPGNVRELHNALSVAMNNCKGGVVDAGDLRFQPARLKQQVELWKVRKPHMSLADAEKAIILDELDRQGGHREKTAKALGMGLTTLKRKLRAWGVITENRVRSV